MEKVFSDNSIIQEAELPEQEYWIDQLWLCDLGQINLSGPQFLYKQRKKEGTGCR